MTTSLAMLLVGSTFVASLFATWALRELARRRLLLDRPNERSAHTNPTPRLGGVAIMGAFLVAAAVVAAASGADRGTFVVLGATGTIAALGLADDLRPLPKQLRLFVQLGAAAAVVAACPDLARVSSFAAAWPPALVAVLSVLWIAWATNLYNFMDGIDGLAGGQAVLAGAAVAVAAFTAGGGVTGWLALALVAAALGFLRFNVPPATIFMGDAGSTAIGFFLASTPFLPETAVSVEAVALALGLFLLDATTTLLRRATAGERWSEPHRTHLYQRPLAHGVTHRTITLTACVAMVPLAVMAGAFELLSRSERGGALALAAATFLGLTLWVRRLERASGSEFGIHARSSRQ